MRWVVLVIGSMMTIFVEPCMCKELSKLSGPAVYVHSVIQSNYQYGWVKCIIRIANICMKKQCQHLFFPNHSLS